MNSGREILEFLKRRKKLEKRVAEMKGGGLAEGKMYLEKRGNDIANKHFRKF